MLERDPALEGPDDVVLGAASLGVGAPAPSHPVAAGDGQPVRRKEEVRAALSNAGTQCLGAPADGRSCHDAPGGGQRDRDQCATWSLHVRFDVALEADLPRRGVPRSWSDLNTLRLTSDTTV